MRHCYVVRVFTAGTDGGNPLGVIPDSTGLMRADMQTIATDLAFSETVFIDWPAGGDPALRIFTPAVELPFAGHPLVGTAWVLNRMGPGTATMTISIGVVEVRIDGDVVWVGIPAIERAVEELEVAGVTADLGISGRRAWRVRVPSEYLVVEVGSEQDVEAARPHLDAVSAATDGLYLFSGRDQVRSRFFAPRLGVNEDPATGSAAVAYAEVMRSTGIDTATSVIMQGTPDHLSEIQISWNGPAVEIGGRVVKDEVSVLEI